MRLFTRSIDTDPNPDDAARIVKSKDRVLMEEENDMGDMTSSRKEALVHDLILVVKSAMTKVNAREMMWCDILAKVESDIRRVVNEATR